MFLNKLTGSAEISSQMAASALLGHHSYQTNDSFWYCYIWQAYHAFSDAILISDDSDNDGSDVQTFETSKPSLGSESLNPQSSLSDDLSCFDDDDILLELGDGTMLPDFGDDTEMLLQIDLDPTNRKIYLTSQVDHYRLRGPELRDLNFYEYCSLVTIIPNKAALPTEPLPPCDDNDNVEDSTDSQKCGRHRNLSFQFLFGHPLFATHVQR